MMNFALKMMNFGRLRPDAAAAGRPGAARPTR